MGNYEPTLEELCEIDNAGEAELKQYYRENGYKVKDVSLDRYYQVRDTDILVLINGKWVGLEAKWDSRISETNNMYIEYYNEEKYNNGGWLTFCSADYLAYGDSQNKLYYVVSLEKLKTFITKNKNTLEQRSFTKPCNGKTSYGFILPITLAEQNNLILETIKLN